MQAPKENDRMQELKGIKQKTIRVATMLDFFVVPVSERGVPLNLSGPYTWDKAVDKVKKLVKTEKVKLTKQVIDAIDMDGFFEFYTGGGVFIVSK